MSTVLFEPNNFRGLKPLQIRITCLSLHWKLCIKFNTNHLKQRLNAFHVSQHYVRTMFSSAWQFETPCFCERSHSVPAVCQDCLHALLSKWPICLGSFFNFCENWSERVWEANNYIGLIVPLRENEVSSVQTIGAGWVEVLRISQSIWRKRK